MIYPSPVCTFQNGCLRNLWLDKEKICKTRHPLLIKGSESNRGQTIVEFSFIILVLFVFILGIMEGGIVLYNKGILTDACREGARAGVLFRVDETTYAYDPLTETEIRTVINNYLNGRLLTFGPAFNPNTDIHVSWAPDPPTHKGKIDVQVHFIYTFMALPRLAAAVGGALGDGTLTISARSIMKME